MGDAICGHSTRPPIRIQAADSPPVIILLLKKIKTFCGVSHQFRVQFKSYRQRRVRFRGRRYPSTTASPSPRFAMLHTLLRASC